MIKWKLTKLEREVLRGYPLIIRPFIYLWGVLMIVEAGEK